MKKNPADAGFFFIDVRGLLCEAVLADVAVADAVVADAVVPEDAAAPGDVVPADVAVPGVSGYSDASRWRVLPGPAGLPGEPPDCRGVLPVRRDVRPVQVRYVLPNRNAPLLVCSWLW